MSAIHYFTTIDSPLGTLVLTGDGENLTGLYNDGHRQFEAAQEGIEAPQLFQDAIEQLAEYFAGQRSEFDLPLKPQGTEFQRRVWDMLRTIPCGTTTSYGALGRKLKNPGASRAVGSANARNPLLIIVPCHRAVAANGALSGFAGGTAAKRWLLQHEQRRFSEAACG